MSMIISICCLHITKQIVFPAGNENEKQDKDKQSMPSSVTPIASVGDGVVGTVVMLVSHPPVQTCSNPVLQQYRVYLQSVYRARDLAPADKYLPTLKAKYINLAIVHKEFYSREQRDEFTRATLHGGIDEILQNKSSMLMKGLMTKSDKPVKFILVEGPPGIGKSTFAWEVCRRWDKIPKLSDYDVVVLVRLREKWALNATSLPDLFRYPPDPGFSTSIAEELNMSQGCNLVLVLDGFDEVSHKFHEDSVLKSILRRELLPECAIILTTRPSARSTLRSIFQPQVNKHIEIIGFTEKERVQYITQVFSDKPELQRSFLKYMFHIPHIKSMMYVPLNCAIIAQVYDESQGNRNLAIPRTKTQLYQALTHSLITRYMKSKENDIDTCTCTSTMPEGLPEEEMAKFKILAKFAFDSYHNKQRKVTFFEEDTPGGLVHFGFMNESTALYASRGMEQTFSFLHLSLQEYLAAWHLANGYSTECQIAYHKLAVYYMHRAFQREIYRSEEVNTLISMLLPLVDTLAEPAKFLAGITGMRCKSVDSSPWEEYLKSIDINAVNDRILFCSFFDAQNPEILRQCFSAKEMWLKFSIGRDSTPHDSYVISYCLSHFSAQFDLDIYLKDENRSHLEMFARGLHDHCKSSTVLKIKCLNLFVSTADFKMSKYWIYDVSRYFVTELETICINTHREEFFEGGALMFLRDVVNLKSLEVCSDGGIACWGWLDAVTSLNRLTELHISSRGQCSPPPPDSLHVLIQSRLTIFICHVATVQCIALSSTPPHVHAILKSVIISKQIVILDIQSVSREAMASVRNILLHCYSLIKLKLSETKLGYDGILHICSALRNNTTLYSIEIYDEIKHTRLSLPECECQCDLIDTVALPRKITSAGFLLELNDILKTNRTLTTMNIRSELFWPFLLDIELENILAVSRNEFQPIELDVLSHNIMLLGLQQFNAGIIRSGIPPKLKRSYSSSDLKRPQISLSSYRANWCGTVFTANEVPEYHVTDANRGFEHLVAVIRMICRRTERLYPIPSFTCPDTDMLQPLSKLDPRLKACLTSLDSKFSNIMLELD